MKISRDGREFLNDPGPERAIPEEETWADLKALGKTPDDLPDPKDQAKYREWLEANPDA